MLTEEGIETRKKRHCNGCLSHSHSIPSSARAAGTFSHGEKDDDDQL